MAKPFKFRYVNEIVGAFVLVVILLVIVGVVIAGRAQGWFEPTHTLILDFPEEGSLDLQKGAEVRILGALVGSVQEITVAENGEMKGRIHIKGDFIRFVRDDSIALVKKKFGVAGDAYVEITKGSGEQLREGDLLVPIKDTEIMEMVQEVVAQVKESTVPAIEQAQKAIEEYTLLAADLRDPEGDLQKLISHLAGIAEGLEEGKGTVGQLLRDPSLANELREITGKINESLAGVNEILADFQTTSSVLSDEAQDLSGVVLQTRSTMREAEKLVEGLQRHWLLRRYVDQTTPSETISPAAVGGAL